MTSRDFCYWLQGFFEISNLSSGSGMNPSEVVIVRKHLDLVFAHEIDPSQGPPSHQSALNEIHNPDPNAPRPRC